MSSHWNHRIVQTKEGYELCEVYYDEDGEPYAYGPARAFGDTPEEIQEYLDWMLLGAARPVVDKWKDQRIQNEAVPSATA